MKKITRLVESTTNFQSERASVRSYISRRAEMSDGTTPLQKMGRNDDSRRYEKMRCTKTTAKTNTDAASGAERNREETDRFAGRFRSGAVSEPWQLHFTSEVFEKPNLESSTRRVFGNKPK